MKSNPPQGRRKLLVTTSTFPRWRGDAEPSFVFDLSRRLKDQYDVTVLAPHAPGLEIEKNWEGMVIRRFRYAPEPLETLAYQGGIQSQLRANAWKYFLVPLFLLAQWRATRMLLRDGRYDVVHAHWLFPQGLIALLCGKTPVIVTAHGSDLHSLKGWIFSALLQYVLSRARVVTVVSAAMADRALGLYKPIRDLRVLPMGVDLHGQFTPSTEVREEAAFLFVGRLLDSKGLGVLLEAFALLLRQAPKSRLIVIGNGPERDRYLILAQSLGIAARVEFIGALPAEQLPAWYRRATALVGPSRAEGLGMVFIEAAGCNCPIIASDLPAIREIISDGESGLLVSPDNPTALAAAMHRILMDSEFASRLGLAARTRVLERYDWTISANGYVAAIEAALVDSK